MNENEPIEDVCDECGGPTYDFDKWICETCWREKYDSPTPKENPTAG